MSIRRSLATDALVRRIFSRAHKPHRNIPVRQKAARTIPGIFPSDKCAQGHIRTRLPLMMDGLLHVVTDPDVVGVAAYPVKADYWSTDDGTKMKREHVPDLGVLMSDGSVVVIDYEPYAIQSDFEWIAKRTDELKAHFHEAYGWSYALHDERSLYRQPRFANIQTMWANKRRRLQSAQIDELADEVLKQPLPMSIGALTSSLGLWSMRATWSGGGRSDSLLVGEVNLVFTAVMQLAIAGSVKVDLGTPFSSNSIVSRRKD